MRKTTAYGRKKARQTQWQRDRHTLANPAAQAVLRSRIEDDIAALKTGAALHAYTGSNVPALCNLAGRLIFIVCHAAQVHGLEQSPEARILASTANALGDLNECPEIIEKQRASIVAGLAAIDRIMPRLHTYSLADGALLLEELLSSGAGIKTSDIARALNPIENRATA